MRVAGVDGAEVTGRVVAVPVVLGSDDVEGALRPSTSPEVRALLDGEDLEPAGAPGVFASPDLAKDGSAKQCGARRLHLETCYGGRSNKRSNAPGAFRLAGHTSSAVGGAGPGYDLRWALCPLLRRAQTSWYSVLVSRRQPSKLCH